MNMRLGPFRFDFDTKDDLCTAASIQIGLGHRAFEKHAENCDYRGIIPYIDRLDYLSSCNNELAFVMTVEHLMKLEIPKRAEWIRMLLCELNRISSHFYFLASIGRALSFPILFSKALHAREIILDTLEMITGARLLHNIFCVGGVALDLSIGMEENIRRCVDAVKATLWEFDDLLLFNPIVMKRAKHHGKLTQEMAKSHAITGPNLRATGMAWDLRKDLPYSFYQELSFNVQVGDQHSEASNHATLGDTWNRIYVRMKEIAESIRMIHQILDKLPVGPHLIPLEKITPPPGSHYIKTENPRGELGFYVVSDGTSMPYRVKAKTPSFNMLYLFPKLCEGMEISEIPLLYASLDISLSEVDR